MNPRPTYAVQSIAAPVFGTRGALCGVPTVQVQLGRGGIPLQLDGIVREITSLFARPEDGTMPRWIWLSGEPTPEAHDLVVGFQVLLKRSVYTEADAMKAMGDIGKLPLYDHVAALVTPPAKLLKIELFHSLIATMPPRAGDLDALNRFLECREYNGHRFLETAGNLSPSDLQVLAPHARLWRISPSPVAAPAPRRSPLFNRPRLQPRSTHFRRKSPNP